MKKPHLPILAFGAFIVLSAGTCSNGSSSTHAMHGLAEGKWVLEKVHGQIIQLPEGVETPYLTVDSTGENISGFAGCNRLGGALKISGDSISFPGVFSTRMYCEGTQKLENGFLNALNTAKTFTLKDDVLTLSAGKELAVLRHIK